MASQDQACSRATRSRCDALRFKRYGLRRVARHPGSRIDVDPNGHQHRARSAAPAGLLPTAPPGFAVTEIAGGLAHPRWLYTLPNGDVLMAQSDAPEEHDEGSGIFGGIRRKVMKRAGAGVLNPDCIVLLCDANGSEVAQLKTVFLRGLHSPFGMAL
jgi:glucose/arabinose dehydrogenase